MNEKRASPPTLLDEPLIRGLAKSIRYAVRILAALMVLVIQKYQNTRCDPLSFLRTQDTEPRHRAVHGQGSARLPWLRLSWRVEQAGTRRAGGVEEVAAAPSLNRRTLNL